MATEATLRAKPGDWLKNYIGIKEGSMEHKAILAVFNGSKLCTRYTMTTSDAWCATAVSAAFIAQGLTDIFPCVECSCANMLKLADNNGIWVEDDSYTPGIGDCILYDWQDSGKGDNTGNPDHVGIVTAVSDGKITVIEGNKNDTVGYRTLDVNGKYIRGFITPDFASLATTSKDTDDSSALTAGAKIKLSNASLYASASATKAAGTKTGTYYIWSATVTNNRIRITNSSANVGKSGQITGWVNVSDCTAASSTTSSSGTASNSSSGSGSTNKPSYTVGKTYTLQTEVTVRKGAGTSCAKVGYSGLTADGKKHDSDKDGALDKGTIVTCKAIKTVGSDIWMQIPSGWIAAYYNGDVYVK